MRKLTETELDQVNDIPLLRYMLTLVQVALDWKQKQLQILTQ